MLWRAGWQCPPRCPQRCPALLPAALLYPPTLHGRGLPPPPPHPGCRDTSVQVPPCLRSPEGSLLLKNHYLLIPVCPVVLSPGPPCQETVSPPAGAWEGSRDGDTERNTPQSISRGCSPGRGLPRDPCARKGPPRHDAVPWTSARPRATGSAGLGWAGPRRRRLAPPAAFGPIEAVPEGPCGCSAVGSSGSRIPGSPWRCPGQPGAAQPRGPGLEYLCFMFLIKTKASKVAQRGAAVGSRHPPAKRDLGKAQRDHGAAG